MAGSDWRQLAELAPLVISAVKPGSPEAAAVMRGYLREKDRQQQRRQQDQQFQLQQDSAARQNRLADAQIANIGSDNALAEKRLALERLTSYRGEGQHVLDALSQHPDTVLPAGTDPLQAQNNLVVQNFQAQQVYGVPAGTPQGPLPNMTALVSEGKKRRAQLLIDQLDKSEWSKLDPEQRTQMEQSTSPHQGEFARMPYAQIRQLASVTDIPPAPPKPDANPGSFDAHFADVLAGEEEKRGRKLTRTERAQLRLKARDAYYPDRVQRPTEPSDRKVRGARDAAYQALLVGANLTSVARDLRAVGLDPEVTFGQLRRQIEDDVAAHEARMPEVYTGERSDPERYKQRVERARAQLRASVTSAQPQTPPMTATTPLDLRSVMASHPVTSPPSSVASTTITQAELAAVATRLGITPTEAARQAQQRGLTVVP